MAIGDVSGLIGRTTHVVRLGGRVLIPAFQDAHAHPMWGGLAATQCDLSGLAGKAAYRDRISSYARDHPSRDWVTGSGWARSAFAAGTPHRRDLDEIVSDRPVLLHSADLHSAWVNTAALDLAGVDASTMDPMDGRIERDSSGVPTGTLHEGAIALVARHMPPPSLADSVVALRFAQAHLHSFGIAGWQDAILGEYAGYPDPSPAYRALATLGELTARVSGALWWDRKRGVEQIPELVNRRANNNIGRFHSPLVKIMLDGVVETFAAALSSPYLNDHGEGLPLVDYEHLPEYVKALVGNGFGVHFHATGDAAVAAALGAVAAAGPGPPHQIAHLDVVNPVDVPRFAGLGVMASVQPFWASPDPDLDNLVIPVLGPEREQWLYPFWDLVLAGATLAAGSDWPVTTADPWQGIHVAVNRSYDNLRPLLPAQRLDLATALTAYTAGAAIANGCPDSGVIAPGKFADLAVLDRNPFAAPVEEIRETRVLHTFVGGRLVFDSP